MKNKLAKLTIQQTGDVSSKRVFGNRILLAQFLRGYSGIEEFKDLRPEQIEMVPLRYHFFEGVEQNADMAARIWQRDQTYRIRKGHTRKGRTRKSRGPRSLPVYIISLIDHKSEVDFNVAMQLFYYMACIWKSWEKEMEAKGHNIRSSQFRYPLILPIVYYEGARKWTAPTNLRSRVYDGESLLRFVPDFEYRVVRIRDYSCKELLARKNEMSLIMSLNRAQDGDLSAFSELDADEVNGILRDTPRDVLDIVVGTARSLLRKLNVPEDEAEGYLGKLKEERDMGYLFENMKKLDIQEERRKTEAQRKEAETQKKEAETRKKEAEAQKKEAETQRREAEAQKKEAETQRREAEAQRRRADHLEEELRMLQQRLKSLEASAK